jgi:ubiquinone/menaquinone biosynthesis C-methylase UbiE
MKEKLQSVFESEIGLNGNLISFSKNGNDGKATNQEQTKDIFSDKWTEVIKDERVDDLYTFQFEWFLKLYGFETEEKLKAYLETKPFIIDTGCGLGYKAAWFAKLAPNSTVIGIDISDAALIAAKNYKETKNLFFLKADIANTGIKPNSIDFTVCDQVIMHTENPEYTFKHLSDITKKGGEFACYVYRKKALPRELVDDYFRSQTHNISKEEMWQFSEQLTDLGKKLTELNVTFDCPDIPVLGIKGGTYDVQRFIYWNFLKCFYKPEWSKQLNDSTNYDWYAPSNAKRFSKLEFEEMIKSNSLGVTFFHEEEACYSGRFKK